MGTIPQVEIVIIETQEWAALLVFVILTRVVSSEKELPVTKKLKVLRSTLSADERVLEVRETLRSGRLEVRELCGAGRIPTGEVCS